MAANPRPTVSLVPPPTVALTAPVGCCASVLLRAVGADNTKQVQQYAWWAVAGRAGGFAASLHEVPINGSVVRFDVPEGVLLSSEYLAPFLVEFWKQDQADGGGNLPPDTPVIKG